MTEQTKWCPRCNDHRPIAEFYKNKGRSDGLSPLCVLHQREAQYESIRGLRAQVIEILGSRCERCGFDADGRAFQIDHRNGNGSAQRKEIGAQRTFYKTVLVDPSPFALLCANCNQIKRIEDRERGTRTYQRSVPTEKRQGVGRGNTPSQRAATAEWHANASPEAKQARKDKIAAARNGTKLVTRADGSRGWERPDDLRELQRRGP